MFPSFHRRHQNHCPTNDITNSNRKGTNMNGSGEEGTVAKNERDLGREKSQSGRETCSGKGNSGCECEIADKDCHNGTRRSA